jgi:hypothetical protein
MHEARPGVDTDMRLHAEVPLPAFLRLVHLFVTPPLPALGRGRRSNQRSVNDCASPQQQTFPGQVGIDGVEDGSG